MVYNNGAIRYTGVITMTKRIICIGAALIVTALLVWAYFFFASATVVEMRVVKNQWRWEPSEITIPANARVKLRITNEDTYEHGFAISQLKIDEFMPPSSVITVNLSNIPAGEYPFFCSVTCGEGHGDQTGKLIVRP